MKRKIKSLVSNDNLRKDEIYISFHHNEDNNTELIRLGDSKDFKYVHEPTENFQEIPRDVEYYEFINAEYYLLAMVDKLASNKNKVAMKIYWDNVGDGDFEDFRSFYCKTNIYPKKITKEMALLKWYDANKSEIVENAYNEFIIAINSDVLLIDKQLM